MKNKTLIIKTKTLAMSKGKIEEREKELSKKIGRNVVIIDVNDEVIQVI